MLSKIEKTPGIKGRLYSEVLTNKSAWLEIWRGEILEKFPITFDIGVADFLSTLKYLEITDRSKLDKPITANSEISNVYTVYHGTEDDHDWVMEIVGWTNNTTTVFWLAPQMKFPKNEADRDSHLEAAVTFMRSVLEMVDTYEKVIRLFPQTDAPPWINDRVGNEEFQKRKVESLSLEMVFKDDPPLWLEIVKLFKTGLTDKEIAARLGKATGTISTKLNTIRKAKPDYPLRRIAKPKAKNEEDVKKVKDR